MSRLRASIVASLAVAAFAGLPLVHGDGNDEIRARYTKYEHRIPARDGKRLFTAVYLPKDTTRPRPILLTRTPYSVAPYGVDQFRERLGPSEHFVKENYIFVYQDVRGRFMSEGDWVEMTPHKAKKTPQDVDESTDAWDTIDWLVKNVPGNNGRVGMWGISYPGFYVSASMIDAHPALKAASPQAPIADLYMGDDSYHNGAFMLAANFGFFVNFSLGDGEPKPPPTESSRFDYGTPDGYDFFRRLGTLAETRRYLGAHRSWQEALDHPNYDDYWKARNIAAHLKNIKHAVMTTGGWFDAEDLAGPLLTYRTIEQSSPGSFNAIVMGPWSHGGWSRGDGERLGNLSFGSQTGAYYREAVEYAFFARNLAGAATEPVAEATMFQTGTNDWRRYDAWPPRNVARKAFYLGGGRKLVAAAPAEPEAYDEYVSDPANPVPYLGYTALGMRSDYMTEDQRFAATRPDVAFYETEPLDEDVAVAGPIEVDLHVSTTGTDSDFVVKVVDVYPDRYPSYAAKDDDEDDVPARKVMMGGYQQLVRGEPFRGRFRNSFEKPEAFVPGQPARIRFSLPDVCHVFRRGHRLMVQVQSSWYPLVDLNPQTFVEIPKATAGDFRKATQRVYRGKERASSITLLVEPPRKPEAAR